MLYGLGFYIVGAALKPGFSSRTQFISELNATGTPWALELGWLGFAPIALLLAAFLVLATPRAQVRGASRLGWWLLWSLPLAFAGVALFPCDAGCPIGGSASQDAHDLIGVLTYFASALALGLLALAPAHPRVTPALRIFLGATGVAFVLIFVAMLLPPLAPVRGLLQRGADAALAASLLLLAWRIVR